MWVFLDCVLLFVLNIIFVFFFFVIFFCFFKQKTAYEVRISGWSSDVCSADRASPAAPARGKPAAGLPAAKKLYIQTHGCQMNEYDSARMADVLAAADGLELTDDVTEADVVLVNTCSIREKAQEKVKRKSVVEGKKVAVRVDHGGRGNIKK